ncbi:MAG: hypothetical protein Edafosvirus5_27 [Edafosvirus sp.]|uniref:Uncharacterized protein n=1 Tax=Edafosvirus sp. TaxID=2487765 RepID=A0A3G4ZXG6_9VIRU|nr:MAG: hypothetical protein Edafosvirus5_27 [Edafosvirus sp.]
MVKKVNVFLRTITLDINMDDPMGFPKVTFDPLQFGTPPGVIEPIPPNEMNQLRKCCLFKNTRFARGDVGTGNCFRDRAGNLVCV